MFQWPNPFGTTTMWHKVNFFFYSYHLKTYREKYCWVDSFKYDCLVGRVFANWPGDLGSIPARVIPKTLKIVLDTSLLNTEHYKVHIKGEVEQSWERSSALPYTSV